MEICGRKKKFEVFLFPYHKNFISLQKFLETLRRDARVAYEARLESG